MPVLVAITVVEHPTLISVQLLACHTVNVNYATSLKTIPLGRIKPDIVADCRLYTLTFNVSNLTLSS
jgi:hypothetical protein